jgi:hypothetical protein
MFIEWTPDLSVKNETIDKQHQQWIKLLDDFYEGIRPRKIQGSAGTIDPWDA